MTTKRASIEVLDWDQLVRYIQYLSSNGNKKYKICLIDEEQEEIHLETKDEFETNVQYAKDHGLKSLILTVYIDNVHKFDGIYRLEKSIAIFPSAKLQNLRENLLVEKWYIPVKIDEDFGICLNAAIQFAQEGKLEMNSECKEFIENILPEAFQKLLNTQSVFTWPREIHCGIFDLLELLVDLVGIRLRYPSVPISLLNTLAIVFDTKTTFSEKHKDESIPSNRIYQLDDNEFLKNLPLNSKDSYGWIRSLIQRFIAQNGLKNLRNHFESMTIFQWQEYHCLLQLFSKCSQCINVHHFRSLFGRSIRQAIEFYFQLKTKTEQTNQFNEILIEICFNYEMTDEIHQLLELKTSSNDCYEQLAEDVRLLTMENQVPISNRREKRKQHHENRKEKKRTANIQTYDRTNADDIRRFFAPMRSQISALYDKLQTATAHGNLREVLKIQEKLKLLHPYSARFIADENTPDGTIMQPGQTFRKGWILLNDGSMPWNPEDIQLINLSDDIDIVNPPIIPVIAPHDRAIITVDYRCSQQPGKYESKWILSYRNQTFGPMIWCSIEIKEANKEILEFIDVPLPACFDLTKPYESLTTTNSIYSRMNSIDIQTDFSDNSLETPLIDLTPINEDIPSSNHSLDFVDTVVTNVVSVAKQAKPIFNTLQATTEINRQHEQTSQNSVDDYFEHIEDEEEEESIISNEPMDVLIEMGFTNRAQNQRLLQDNNQDLNKVIEILTLESFD